MRSPCFLILMCCLSDAAYSQAHPVAAVPQYSVHHAKSPIKIDGKIDDSEWAPSQPFDLIFPWTAQTGEKQRTQVRALWDERYLYVSYRIEDRDITAQVRQHDEFVYRDDTVEIFINVKPDQQRAYYCLEMNALGTIMDYVCIDGRYYMRQFDFKGVKVGIQIHGTLNLRGDQDRGWDVELAIPWSNFAEMSGPPKVGTTFTANFNRWDGTEPNRRLSVWADSGLDWPHPHVPERFGRLIFMW